MANICSKHRGPPIPGCVACHTNPKDLFPDWEQKGAEAVASGIVTCSKCKFEYYRIARACPLCNTKEETGGA